MVRRLCQVFYENLTCSVSPFAKGKYGMADVQAVEAIL